MTVELLSLVENALRVAKQALGSHAGKPESGGLPRETHIVAHCVWKEEEHSYGELVDRLSLMPDVGKRIDLRPDAVPDPTTFSHSFDRYVIHLAGVAARLSAATPPFWACITRQHVL